MPRFAARAAALVAVGLVCVWGCSRPASASPVSAAELQKSLVDQLNQAGTPSTWVNCPNDLPGRVGATTRCEVRFSPDNSVTALLTTTEVSGGNVKWEITGPELTRDQLTKRIAGLTSTTQVTCDSGLDGHPGDWVQCQVDKGGVTLAQTVEIKQVLGLALDLAVTPAVPRQQLEDAVMTRLTPAYGRRPDKVRCTGDLQGIVGTAVNCVVTSGDKPDNYVAMVTGVPGGMINFDVAVKPSA